MDTSDLAKRMKDYERASTNYLVRRMPVILRIDGCHFHTFTKGFQKPFDDVLIKTMQQTTKYLCENIQGCVFGYTQSDEITLVLIDYKKLNSSAWFDNRQNKIESVAASMATMIFNHMFEANVEKYCYDNANEMFINDTKDQLRITYGKAIGNGAYFDCRAFNIPVDDVTNNIYWRQLDASRNSIQMLGQAYFSHRELQNKPCNQIQDILVTKKGINWNDLPTYKKRGSSIIKNKQVEAFHSNGTVTVNLRDTSKGENEWIVDLDMPQLKGDGRSYVEQLINFEYED